MDATSIVRSVIHGEAREVGTEIDVELLEVSC